MKHRPWIPWLFLGPNLLGFLIFTLVPVGASLLLAFCSWDLFQAPRWVGLENFYDLVGFKHRLHPTISSGAAFAVSLGWLVLLGVVLGGTWKKPILQRIVGVAILVCSIVSLLLVYEPVNSRFWYFVSNTFYLLLGLPISMACSLVLALLLNRKIRGSHVFRLIFFLPSIVSGVGIYLLWKWIFNSDYGLLNNLIGLIFHQSGPAWLESSRWAKDALIIMNTWATAGGANMILYLAALQNVDLELYEAAQIDGAGAWQKFRAITWPMISPTTAFILTMGLIGGFQGGFDAAFVMTRGGPAGATTTLSYYIFENGFHYFYMGRAAAASWILFLMVLTITWVNWKWMSDRIHY